MYIWSEYPEVLTNLPNPCKLGFSREIKRKERMQNLTSSSNYPNQILLFWGKLKQYDLTEIKQLYRNSLSYVNLSNFQFFNLTFLRF